MNIVFRVDSSRTIGSGHLMRCLSLAANLKKEYNANIYFICRDLDGNLARLVLDNRYNLILLNRTEFNEILQGYGKWLTVTQKYDAEECIAILRQKSIFADKLIIDSYAIDSEWEKMLRPFTKEIMVIDDLANRKHDCDILLDQNLYADMEFRYVGLVPKQCNLLLGPRYALLREEFYIAEKKKRVRDGSINNILVFFGGVDATNETKKTLRALDLLKWEPLRVNVVVGSSNPHKIEIKDICDKHSNWNYLCQVDNMAELMNEADLAIGAGGSTTWERCFLGLPAMVIAVAENQVQIAIDCDKEGIIKYLGYYNTISSEDIKNYIIRISNNGYMDLLRNCVMQGKNYGRTECLFA